MPKACTAILAGLIVCTTASAAGAQGQSVTLVSDLQRRWDAAGFIGWRGVDKSEVAPAWNEWYDVATFGVSTGRYLTSHIKIDVDLSTTSAGRVFSEELVGPPAPFPSYQFRQYEFRRTIGAATLAYQFFENRWVHPFLGVGIEGVREAERVELEFIPSRPPLAAPVPEQTVAYVARPFVAGGLKFYISERGFIRTDVLSTFSTSGAESAVWRIGVGVDF